MSDTPRSTRTGSHWKRPPTKVYDYNYDVGSNYYKGMINHLDKKSAGVSSEPPGPKSFAERIAADSLYGPSKAVNYSSSASKLNSSEYSSRRADVGEYLTDDDSLGRSRPGHFRAPSVSDQIMDYAGVKDHPTMLDEALIDLKRRRAAHFSDAQDDSMFSSKTSMEDSMSKRRNMLRDLDTELANIESGLDRNRSSRKAALAALDEADASASSLAQLSSSSTSSVNVKKRTMKTTVTSETVRY